MAAEVQPAYKPQIISEGPTPPLWRELVKIAAEDSGLDLSNPRNRQLVKRLAETGLDPIPQINPSNLGRN